MSGISRPRRVACLLAAGALAGAVIAESPDGTPSESSNSARIDELLRMIHQQQERLDALQAQATNQPDNMDAQRTEAMRREIRAILSEREFRESMMASTLQAGYNNGFFIRSSDEKFYLQFTGLLQFRWVYYDQQKTNDYLMPRTQRQDRTGFEMTRTRLNLDGWAFSKNLTYALQLQMDAADNYDTVLSTAYINYRFVDAFQVKAGYFKGANSRSEMNDPPNLLMIDHSVVDAVFGFGYVMGVRTWGTFFTEDRMTWMVDVVNSTADSERSGLGRVISTDPLQLDQNPAILARWDWKVLGDNLNAFNYISDIDHLQSPHLDVGVFYAYNYDRYDQQTTRVPFSRETFLPGGYGLTNTNWSQFNQIGADALFKYMGFSAEGVYVARWIDPRSNRAPLYQLTLDGGPSLMQGAFLEMGYFLPIPGFENKLELVGRVGGIQVEEGYTQGSWEYSGGVNYFIHGHNVKLQAEVSKYYEVPISAPYSSLANVNDDALIFRIQLSVFF